MREIEMDEKITKKKNIVCELYEDSSVLFLFLIGLTLCGILVWGHGFIW